MPGSQPTRVQPDSLSAASLIAAARQGLAQPAPAAPVQQWDHAARVHLRHRGRVIGVGLAAATDALASVRAAAAAAAHAALPPEAHGPALPSLDDLSLEVEAVESIESITPQGLAGLLKAIEPGLHGLILADAGRSAVGWPSDPQRQRLAGAPWVKALLREVRPPGNRLPASLTVRRFGAVHVAAPAAPPAAGAPEATEGAQRTPAETEGAQRTLAEKTVGAQRTPAENVVRLLGGVREVPVEAVTRARLVEAATLAGAWLARHQLPSGLFAYEFDPHAGRWSGADSIVRQAGCAWGMATLAHLASSAARPAPAPPGGPEPTEGAPSARNARAQNESTPAEHIEAQALFAAAARRAVDAILRTALRRDGPGGLSYLVSSEGQPRLGAIPLFLLALDELRPDPRPVKALADPLTATLLAVQAPSGAFGFQARGLTLEGSEIYTAGQCTLALARRSVRTGRARYGDAVRRALAYYRDWWDAGNQDLSFLTWMIQACDASDAAAPDEAAVAFAYAMADWALPRQFGPDHPNPLWVGGFEGGPGIGTAAYMEGMISALQIARRHDDKERAGRYRGCLLLALRFLLSLTLEPPDLALLPHPGEGATSHRGAVRRSLRSPTLRCDNAQHLLMAALRTALLLTDDDFLP